MRPAVPWRPVAAVLLLLIAPLAGDAQPLAKFARVGVLTLAVAPSTPLAEAFRQGLREYGYVEGQNLAFEYRYAEGRADRLPALAAELVRLKVDVIVTESNMAALAARVSPRPFPS